MLPRPAHVKSVYMYTVGTATIAVSFPNGECNCRNCYFCYSRKEHGNFSCGLMPGVYFSRGELSGRHPACPIEFPETEF